MTLGHAVDLLGELQARGVRLWRAGDRLRYRPRDAVSREHLSPLAEHKKDLLALIDLLGENCEVEIDPQPFAETVDLDAGWLW